MKGKRKQIMIAFLAAGLTVVVLLAGQNFWHKTQIEQPIQLSLKAEGEIENWNIQYDSGKVQLMVKFNKIDNLQDSYRKITTLLDKQLGNSNYSIEIKNQTKPNLTKFYQKIQPVLYEGLATGRYTWMVQEIDGQAQEQGLTTKLQFDQNYLFLQILDQDGGYYKIIPRASEVQERQLVSNQ